MALVNQVVGNKDEFYSLKPCGNPLGNFHQSNRRAFSPLSLIFPTKFPQNSSLVAVGRNNRMLELEGNKGFGRRLTAKGIKANQEMYISLILITRLFRILFEFL